MISQKPATRMSTAVAVGVLTFLLLQVNVALAGDHADEHSRVDVAMATIKGCKDDGIVGSALLHESASSEGIKQVGIMTPARTASPPPMHRISTILSIWEIWST